MRHLATLILLVLLLLPGTAQALLVDGLYSHRVAVADHSDEERTRAYGEAFAAVILKLTGQERWLEHPAVAAARRRAAGFVEAVAYTDQQRYIEIDFSEQLMDELLRRAGIPMWGSNRPSVLVWMVLQQVTGERRVLALDAGRATTALPALGTGSAAARPISEEQVGAFIQAIANERAVPMIFPLLDLEDRRNLPPNTLWRLDEEILRTASRRYGADSILAGRLLETPGGELVGLWHFIFQGSAIVFDGLDQSLEAYLHTALQRVTNELAANYAVVRRESRSYSARLRVDGVADLAAYVGLLRYLQSLSVIETITTAALEGERIELQLRLDTDPRQLTEVIGLDRDLLPVSSTRGTAANVLHYRWTR